MAGVVFATRKRLRAHKRQAVDASLLCKPVKNEIYGRTQRPMKSKLKFFSKCTTLKNKRNKNCFDPKDFFNQV